MKPIIKHICVSCSSLTTKTLLNFARSNLLNAFIIKEVPFVIIGRPDVAEVVASISSTTVDQNGV